MQKSKQVIAAIGLFHDFNQGKINREEFFGRIKKLEEEQKRERAPQQSLALELQKKECR